MTGPTLATLGRTDLEVPPVVLGTMARRPAAAEVRERLFHAAVELGMDTFDTAPLYDFGATERLLAEVLASHRDLRLKVLTKVGLRWSADSRGPVHFETRDAGGGRRVVRRDCRPEAVRLDVEESLRRLGVDRLDLVQVHFRDADTPIDETMGALSALRQEGKLREIGVSNFSLDEIRAAQRALGEVPLAAVQIRLNLMQRDPLAPSGIVSWCVENGVGVLAYSPLAEGRLARLPIAGDRSLARSARRALQAFARRADEAGMSMADLAVRWLTQQQGVTAAVVGVSSIDQLRSLAHPDEIGQELLQDVTRLFEQVALRAPWEQPRWRRLLMRWGARLGGE